MCTVTFLPLREEGFLLTSNRDESSVRKKSSPPNRFEINRQPVVYPRDGEAGGTWIAAGVNGFTLCLLNGAFQRHDREPHYRLSRGLMLLDFYKYNNPELFYKNYNFSGIEPFTLIIVGGPDSFLLYELRWDGATAHLKQANHLQPHIWSSVTLYNEDVVAKRKLWFRKWLDENPDINMSSVMNFHQFGGEQNSENGLVMNRSGVLYTLSITSVLNSETEKRMKYFDLPLKQVFELDLI